MKTQKLYLIPCILTAATLTWTARGESPDPSVEAPKNPISVRPSSALKRSGPEAQASATLVLASAKWARLQAAINHASADIRQRIQMPAILEVCEDPGEEAEVTELFHSGWIVDASLEEVEAALQAAAKTLTSDDDVAARILAHRASCRFIYKGKN